MGPAAGVNHLRQCDGGSYRPYCGHDQLGYLWDAESFERLSQQGKACLACRRTLERDYLAAQLAELRQQRG